MKNPYIELKIRKKYLYLCIIVLILLCGCGGYYIWCSYHPIVDIQVVDGGKGKDLKVQTISMVVAPRTRTIPSFVELNERNLWIQYDHMNEYFLNNYKAGDIKLHVDIKDHKAILKYTGTATKIDGKEETIDTEIVCDYALEANISY